MAHRRREGIVYDLHESGTARLIFDAERTKFEGILETSSGETLGVRGLKNEGTSCSDGYVIMDLDIVDNEEGFSFQVTNVAVRVSEHSIIIESPTIKFVSADRFIGMKAATEIQQYMTPKLNEKATEVFVGKMKITLLTSHKPQPGMRRESLCCADNDLKILEVSEDFLA